MREMLNAIRYMARSGGGWRMLPTNFKPWQTVYRWFRRFVRRLMFRTIHDVALRLDRKRAGARQARQVACWIVGPSRHHQPSRAAMTRTRRWSAARGTSRWTAYSDDIAR